MSEVRAFCFAIAFAILWGAPAGADDAVKAGPTAAPTAVSIQVSPGDSWVYDVRDDVTGDLKGTFAFRVTKVSGAGIETRATQHKQVTNADTTTVELFDGHWRMKDNGKIVFQPHADMTGVPDDLQIGKSWSFKYEAERKGAAQTREFAGVGKVEAWEQVKLPNGSVYDAFKIDVTATTEAVNHRKHESHTVMWFAPAVNRVVKRIDETRENGKLSDSSEQTLREYKPAARM